MSDLRSPRGPVVRRVLAPDVELVPDALLGEERGEAVRLLERPGRVLPRTPADDEQQADLRAQPVQMVAAETGDVVGRVVEVDGVAAFAPADGRDVVDARQAEGQREEVAAAEGEVGGVEGAERDTCCQDLLEAPAVGVDQRDDVVEKPILVAAVPARATRWLWVCSSSPRAPRCAVSAPASQSCSR